MTRKTLNLTDQLYDYLLSVSLRETGLLRALRDETAKQPQAIMQITPDQGQLMALLITMLHAKKVIEIGVFTGYSSLCMAMALPVDGHIVACDTNKEYTDIARKYWQKAGVAHKVELILAPAIKTLDNLLARGEQGTYDFVFIDAGKPEYPNYYERSLQLIRKGGLIVIDNVLWYGKPADPDAKDKDTLAIRELNEMLYRDKRVNISMLAIADGLTLALKL